MTFLLGAIGTFMLFQALYAGPGGIFGSLTRVESLKQLWVLLHAFIAGAERLWFHAMVTHLDILVVFRGNAASGVVVFCLKHAFWGGGASWDAGFCDGPVLPVALLNLIRHRRGSATKDIWLIVGASHINFGVSCSCFRLRYEFLVHARGMEEPGRRPVFPFGQVSTLCRLDDGGMFDYKHEFCAGKMPKLNIEN